MSEAEMEPFDKFDQPAIDVAPPRTVSNVEDGPKKVFMPLGPIETQGWRAMPKTFEDQQRYAKMYLQSKVLPARFKTEAEILTALHFASEHFPGKEMTALRQIAVIEGSATIFGDLPLALVQRSGVLEDMKESFNGEPFKDNYEAVCEVKRKGTTTPVIRKFSVDDAKRAGLWTRGTYQKYPHRMLQMRARTWALKDSAADILTGIGILEYDHNIVAEEIDVTDSNKLEKFKQV